MRTQKNIGFMIQVRMGSIRLPGKAMLPIAGKSLLSRVIHQFLPLSRRGRIIVATTRELRDNPVVETAQAMGVDCFRGEEEDALSRFIGAAEKFSVDVIVRITGDNPLTDPVTCEEMLNCLIQEEMDYVGVQGLPLGTASEVCATEALKKAARMTEAPIHRESITSFLYTNPDIFRVKMLDRGRLPYSRPHYRLTVDTEEDRRLMEEIYKALGDSPSLSEVVALLDKHPELRSINSHVTQRTLTTN